MLFDNDILLLICTESNRYAEDYLRSLQNNNETVPEYLKRFSPFTPSSIMLYIGCLLYMGLVQLPEKKMHWNQGGFFPKTLLTDVMTRDHFYLVSKFLHLNNEETANKEDKLYKVRPLTSRLIRNWQKYYGCNQDITIDEKMIKFDGNLKWKQYDPSKPVRHGIKSFLVCEARTGYTYNEEIYCGKDQKGSHKSSTDQVVYKLLDGFANKGHRLFMDNFFTSFNLISELETRMIGVSGTLRKNRKNIPKRISKDKVKKGEILAFRMNNVMVFTWCDKRCVRFITNLTGGIEEMDTWTKMVK